MLIIGSRGSALALAQAKWVKDGISARHPDTEVVIKVITTTADKDQISSIRSGSSVGVFVKEIEAALLRREIDLAVHSMKDVPTSIPEGLEIGAIPEREDARDALIARKQAVGIRSLPPGAVIGTGSIRRQAQICAVRKDLKIVDIRGNVDTRLKKLSVGSCDALILACAGLKRLGFESRITDLLDFSEMLPPAGQGALSLEIRKNDNKILPYIEHLHHKPTALTVLAERAFLVRVGGGCNAPVAVHASIEGDLIKIEGMVASPDGSRMIREVVTQDCQLAQKAAAVLADRIMSMGGRAILSAIR